MRPNKKICTLFADAMDELDSPVNCDLQSQVPGLGSTDMGTCIPFIPLDSIPCMIYVNQYLDPIHTT